MRPLALFVLGSLFGGLISLLFCYYFPSTSGLVEGYHELRSLSIQMASGSTEEFMVAVADTTEERTRGLQFIPYLNSDQGMWFVFGEEDMRTFWMKDTLIPLDILFLNKDMKIVSIVRNAPPCYRVDSAQQNCERYPSLEKAQYVLEINAGTVDRLGTVVGDTIQVE